MIGYIIINMVVKRSMMRVTPDELGGATIYFKRWFAAHAPNVLHVEESSYEVPVEIDLETEAITVSRP